MSYQFKSREQLISENIAKAELESSLKAGIFLLTNTLLKDSNRSSNFTFDDPSLQNVNTNVSDLIQNLVFAETSFINSKGIVQITPELEIPICTISIDDADNIHKIDLVNQSDSIIQVISSSSKAISIKGILIGKREEITKFNPQAGKPVRDMQKLDLIKNSKTAINVISPFLSNLGISKLYIQSVIWDQAIEKKNVYGFTLRCYSQKDEIRIV